MIDEYLGVQVDGLGVEGVEGVGGGGVEGVGRGGVPLLQHLQALVQVVLQTGGEHMTKSNNDVRKKDVS